MYLIHITSGVEGHGNKMGRHKEWRKIARRERRRKIRKLKAAARDKMPSPSSLVYRQWLKEQDELEAFELAQIEKMNHEENEKWLNAEKQSIDKWNQLQEKLKKTHLQRLEKDALIRQEWEEEQRKIKEAADKLKQKEEENKRIQQVFIEKLELFLSGDSTEPPKELLVGRETKPTLETCPFFSKTACCRFGDQCSRNHQYPGITKTLMAVNFFTHFGLDNAHFNEYDTDVMLEYEDSDTYRDFKEFFYDVIPEFEKFGKVVQFKVRTASKGKEVSVCNNYEKHLRGNTYIEYTELRSAVAAYRALHTRWYGGRQISLQFCSINSWRHAICGLQSNKRCPKGRSCNFMHVFRNPNNLFHERSPRAYNNRNKTPHRTSWRWSESPEVEEPTKRVSASQDKYKREKERKRHRSTSCSRRRRNKDSSRTRNSKK